jgi:hypothetical protein
MRLSHKEKIVFTTLCKKQGKIYNSSEIFTLNGENRSFGMVDSRQ